MKETPFRTVVAASVCLIRIESQWQHGGQEIALLRLVIGFEVFDLVALLTAGGPGQATTVASCIDRVAVISSTSVSRRRGPSCSA